MSFSIAPGQAAPTASTTSSQTAQDARSRAISMLSASTPQNPNGEPPSAPPEVLMAQAAQGQDGEIVESEEAPQPEAKQPEKALSPQYAALARKEKQIRSQVQEVRAKEAAIQAREAAIAAKEAAAAKALELESRLEKDPLGVLAERGYTYDKLTQAALSLPSEQDQQYKALEAKIAELEGKLGNTQKTYEEQQTNAYKQALNQIRQDTAQLVKGNPDFEAIAATGSVNDVVELIETTFKKDGILLSVEEAAREVEEYLAEEAFKLTRLQKIQKRLAPKAQPEPTPQQQARPQTQPPMKTLTNSIGANRPLTGRERAILAFKGELKK